MRAAFDVADRLAYYRLNREIHSAIVAAGRNPVLAREHTQINARLFRVRFAPNVKTGLWQQAMAEHEAMVTALRARDGERLAAILKDHLSHAWRRSGHDPLAEQTTP